ncbi:hypothetical protein AQUSIP_02400 [Aquicella siphonis]|uniref:Lysine-specific metallo-endopeptidase domain-containing protein n=1 Tax=Aquicella siphonis TaxID=254247 RepID=A0A5E4PF61_9COXI|nr:hypothetical protein [Aquicella siphonis]VVC74966.1 hypothetical protein AQUSIP_02400 [Aquicella siphonis]
MHRKNIVSDKKSASPVTQSGQILSLKLKTQPHSREEIVMLNKVYNEAIFRLERAVTLVDQLCSYLSQKQAVERRQRGNIKQLLIDEGADQEILNALKMLKRHFYINITNNSIDNILAMIFPIRNNLLKVFKGFLGELELNLEIFPREPGNAEIANFSGKTYVLSKTVNGWDVSYYEDRIRKKIIDIREIDANINQIPDVDLANINKSIIMRAIMLYHANQSDSKKTDKVFISNISRKKQQNPQNRVIGYVHYERKGIGWENYGPIYLDYRLLQASPLMAMLTLIHEAAHRYAWVMDRGYYHGEKALKNGQGSRPYPDDVGADRMKATNNADSYAYFVCDLTGMNQFYLSGKLPAWAESKKLQPVPEEKKSPSLLQAFSLFALGAVAIGGICLIAKHAGVFGPGK